MKKILIVIVALALHGCAAPQQNFHSSDAYQQREEITTSLFASDSSQLSNEAAEQILNGKISIPNNARAALLKLPSNHIGIRYYGYNYLRSEDYLDLQQSYVDTLTNKLLSATSIKNVVSLPSFVSGEKLSLSQMREAAVRMQANLLVIYKIESNIFDNFRLFQNNQVKAFSNCEVAVLDTKTGILPFTNVVTKKHLVEARGSDTEMAETRKRAEIEVNQLCLNDIGTSVSNYLNGIKSGS